MAKPKAEGVETNGAVKPSEVRQVISGKKLKSHLELKKKARSDAGDINSRSSETINKDLDKFNFSRRIFSFLSMLYSLPNEKLKVQLEDLEHGLEAGGFNARAASVPGLDLQRQEQEDGDDETPAESAKKQPGENVKPFPAPSSVAAG